MSEIGTPAAALPHYVWLISGMTDVEIQAALNDPWIYGVFLAPGGVYAIGAAITVPNGKFLMGASVSSDWNDATRPNLVLAANVNVQVTWGTLSYVNIVWDSTSAVPAIVGNAGLCEYVYVVQSAATSTIPAFQGTFYKIYRCTVAGMSGVELTGNPGTAEYWTQIEEIYVTGPGPGAGAVGVWLNAGLWNVRIRGCRIDGVDTGIEDSFGSSQVHDENNEVLNTNVAGINHRGTTFLWVSDAKIQSCSDGLKVESCSLAKIARISVTASSGNGITFNNSPQLEASDLSCTDGTGVNSVYALSLLNATICGISVDNHVYGGGPCNGILFDQCQGGSHSRFTVRIVSGTANASGIVISRCVGGTYSDFDVESTQGNGIVFSSNNDVSADTLSATQSLWGIYVQGSTNGEFSDLNTFSNVEYGTVFDNCIGLSVSSISSRGNGLSGVYCVSNSHCQFTGISSTGNTQYGILESTNSYCGFSSFTANANVMDGINAGNAGSSYNNWNAMSATTNGGQGFVGAAVGVANCNLDGLFTQGNVGGASAFGGGWIFANLVAV